MDPARRVHLGDDWSSVFRKYRWIKFNILEPCYNATIGRRFLGSAQFDACRIFTLNWVVLKQGFRTFLSSLSKSQNNDRSLGTIPAILDTKFQDRPQAQWEIWPRIVEQMRFRSKFTEWLCYWGQVLILARKKTAMFVTCSSATPCSQASTLLLVRVRPAPTWTCDSCSTSQQRLDSPFTSLRSLMTVIVFEPEICISPKKGPSLQLICGLFISWFCGQWKSIGVLHAITSWNAKHSIQMHPGNASGHFVTLPRRQMKAFGKPGVSTWNVGNPRDQIQAGLNGK